MVAFAALTVLLPSRLYAQAYALEFEATPLADALADFDTQAGLNLVYAQRLVQGRTTTCTYRGKDAQDALNCLLEETGLEARRVRHRQYVIVVSGADRKAVPRGMLAGFVSDAETGELLPSAHIFLPELGPGHDHQRSWLLRYSVAPARIVRGELLLSRFIRRRNEHSRRGPHARSRSTSNQSQ